MKDILKLSPDSVVGQAPQTIVIANDSWISRIGSGNALPAENVQFVPVPANASLAPASLHEAELLVLEVDASEFATLSRLEFVRRTYPDLPIIAAVNDPDIRVMRTLLRHGITNVVALPFDNEELASEIYNVGAKMAEAKPVALAPTACVIGSMGRSGATSILVHLADALVRRSKKALRCCILDLDIQAGQTGPYTGIESTRCVLDLLEAQDRLDQDMIRNVAVKARDGIFIIAAPSEILPIEQVDIDQVHRIIQLARAEFDILLIDLPSSWTNWSLSVADRSDRLLLVTEQSLTPLRQTRRHLEMFREVGISSDHVDIIVNRASLSRFARITLNDVAETLNQDVLAAIREDKTELVQAQDEGKLVTEVNRKGVFAKDVAQLANKFSVLLGGETA